MVYRWSFAFTKNILEDVLRRLKEVLKISPRRRLDNVLKKIVATSISDKPKTSLRPKLRLLYGVFATSLCRLGYRHFPIVFKVPVFIKFFHVDLRCWSKGKEMSFWYWYFGKILVYVYTINDQSPLKWPISA